LGGLPSNSLKEDFPASLISISAVQLDITDDAFVAEAYRYISDKYNRLDVLINDAGVFHNSEEIQNT
jgi:NADP-dependent 3-hydroxy acid dehydrogenase YdfG